MKNKYTEVFKICYPNCGNDRKCSIIQGIGTYGEEQDLFGIMGLLTEIEEEYDSVAGYLTAENVFNRIKKDYMED